MVTDMTLVRGSCIILALQLALLERRGTYVLSYEQQVLAFQSLQCFLAYAQGEVRDALVSLLAKALLLTVNLDKLYIAIRHGECVTGQEQNNSRGLASSHM